MKQRGWALGIVSVLAMASLGAAWKLWRNQLGDLSLADEMAAARREGVPLEPRDLMEPEISPAVNAAGPYLQATEDTRFIRKHGTWTKQISALFPYAAHRPMKSLTRTERQKLRALLAPYAPAIALIRKAGLRPTMVIHRPWSFGMAFEDAPGMRQLIRVLTLRAELRDCEGDTQGALEDLEVLARASALLHSAKSVMEGYLRFDSERSLLETLGRIVARHPQDRQIPNRVRRILSSLGPSPHLRGLLSCQLIDGRQVLAFFAAGGDACTPGSPWLRSGSVRNANEAYLISYWRSVFKRIPEDPLDFDGTRQAMKQVFETYDEIGTLRTEGIAIQELTWLVDQLAEIEARRRVARTAADVLERWQKDRRLPFSPPIQRSDPFGKQLRYLRYESGFTVYSLGKDLQDDQGKMPSRRNEEKTDIAWRLELPSSATIAVAKR